MRTKLIALIAGAIVAAAGLIAAGEAGSAGSQRQAIEEIVREYLLKNPVVIRDAIEALRVQETAAAAERARQALAAAKEELLGDKNAQYLGSADADVTLVEFFDYRCGYCKQIAPTLQKLVEADPKVRVVLKELPILGPQSEFAAKAALAARKSGKYVDFHRALMASPDLTEAGIRETARKIGIDASVLAGVSDPEIDKVLQGTAALADRLEIRGTPGLVVGDQVLPGAVNLEMLTQLVGAERRARKAN